MPSRSLRRIVATVAFAALLAPLAGLQAAQSRPQPAPVRALKGAQGHSPLVEFLLRLLTSAPVGTDGTVMMDPNG